MEVLIVISAESDPKLVLPRVSAALTKFISPIATAAGSIGIPRRKEQEFERFGAPKDQSTSDQSKDAKPSLRLVPTGPLSGAGLPAPGTPPKLGGSVASAF